MQSRQSIGVVLLAGIALAGAANAVESLPSKEPDVGAWPPDGSASLEELRQSFAKTRDARVGLRAARALVGVGRWTEALGLYREISELVLPPGAPSEVRDARLDATVERQRLLTRMPAVVITVAGAALDTVEVTVNGVRVQKHEFGLKHPVDPGAVRVRGALGRTRIETRVQLSESEVKPIRLVFEPEGAPPVRAPGSSNTTAGNGIHSSALRDPSRRPDEAGDAQRLIGYLALGVGGAALLTGGVFSILALRDEAKLEGRCPDGRCPNALRQEIDSYESKKVIATIGMTAGTVVAAGGAVLYATASRAAPRQSSLGLVVFCDGRQAGIWGRF